MFNLKRDTTKRLVAVHGWSGVILGLVLYVVVLTGALVVFAHEIGAWSMSGTRSDAPLSVPLDSRMRELSREVAPEYLHDVTVYGDSGGRIIAFFHTHGTNDSGKPDDVGVMIELDPVTMEEVSRVSGFGSDLFGSNPRGALEEFIVDLHVNLTAPEPWGLYATGILGLIMLLSAISGLLIHRHLLKDLFLAPRRSGSLLRSKDRHVLAGSWSLPFAFVLAFTGSFFSFAFSLGLPLVSATAFNGDQVAMLETLVGETGAEDDSPAEPGNLDAMIASSTALTGTVPVFLTIAHMGRADSKVMIYHDPHDGGFSGVQHRFDGVTGEHLGMKPLLGTAPSAGNTAYNLMAALHFGHFAGLLSKIVWLSLGLAMCYVVITGLEMWVVRRSGEPAWRGLARCIPAVGYGLPVGLAGAAIGYFLTIQGGDPLTWTPAAFVLTAGLALLPALLIADIGRLVRIYRLALGALLLVLPLFRLGAGGVGWIEATLNGNGVVVSLDLLCAGGGVGLLLHSLGVRPRNMRRSLPDLPGTLFERFSAK